MSRGGAAGRLRAGVAARPRGAAAVDGRPVHGGPAGRSVVHRIGDEVGDSSTARHRRGLGGTTALEQAFIAVAFSMLARWPPRWPSLPPCNCARMRPASEPIICLQARLADPLADKRFGDRTGRIGGRDAGRRAGGRPHLRRRRRSDLLRCACRIRLFRAPAVAARPGTVRAHPRR